MPDGLILFHQMEILREHLLLFHDWLYGHFFGNHQEFYFSKPVDKEVRESCTFLTRPIIR